MTNQPLLIVAKPTNKTSVADTGDSRINMPMHVFGIRREIIAKFLVTAHGNLLARMTSGITLIGTPSGTIPVNRRRLVNTAQTINETNPTESLPGNFGTFALNFVETDVTIHVLNTIRVTHDRTIVGSVSM
jgi:hypothetical protein